MRYHCPNCGSNCDPIATNEFGLRLIECIACDNFYWVYPTPEDTDVREIAYETLDNLEWEKLMSIEKKFKIKD